VEGGSNAATNAASQAGGVELIPGASTGSTQGLQGLDLQGSVYVKGATVTQWNLECESAAMTVADCPATPNNWLGIAEVVNTNTVQVLTDAQTFVNASAAVTLGHTVCAGSTAGKVTDSGGTASCTNAQGSTVGVVMATSGAWTLPDTTAVTATTTLPLIQMNTAVQLSTGGGTTGNGITNTTPVTVAANSTSDQQLMELALTSAYLNSTTPIHFFAAGLYSTGTAQTPTLQFKVKLCTVSGCGSGTVVTLYNDTTTATTALVTNQPWNITLNSVTVTTGASGTLEIHGNMAVDLGALATTSDTIYADETTAVSSAINLTGLLYLDVTVATSTGNTGNSITQRLGIIAPYASTPTVYSGNTTTATSASSSVAGAAAGVNLVADGSGNATPATQVTNATVCNQHYHPIAGSSDQISSATSFATTASVGTTCLAVGTKIDILSHGVYTTSSTTAPKIAFQVNAGSTSGICPAPTTGSSLPISITSGDWELECHIQINTTGSSGTAVAWGKYCIVGAGTLATDTATCYVFGNASTGTVTYNTSTSETVSIQQTATPVSGQTYNLTALDVIVAQ
jgi:hypothetical protein